VVAVLQVWQCILLECLGDKNLPMNCSSTSPASVTVPLHQQLEELFLTPPPFPLFPLSQYSKFIHSQFPSSYTHTHTHTAYPHTQALIQKLYGQYMYYPYLHNHRTLFSFMLAKYPAIPFLFHFITTPVRAFMYVCL